jgi:hypothetical protein
LNSDCRYKVQPKADPGFSAVRRQFDLSAFKRILAAQIERERLFATALNRWHDHWSWSVTERLEAVAASGFGAETIHRRLFVGQAAWVRDVIRATAE